MGKNPRKHLGKAKARDAADPVKPVPECAEMPAATAGQRQDAGTASQPPVPQAEQTVRRHLWVTFLAIAIAGFFALIAVKAKPLDPIRRAVSEFSFTDIYYEIQRETSTVDTNRVITIVDITHQETRSSIAQTLMDIESCEPKVIGVDVCFDNEGEDWAGNDSLINVAETYDNIVFALRLYDWSGDEMGWATAGHSFFQAFLPITEGTSNVPRALYDNLKRKVSLYELYEGKPQPSFARQIVNMYAGKDVFGDRTDDVNINFSPTYFRVLQPGEVKEHQELIEGQIVLYGAMHDSGDMHWTPLGRMAGVELWAYGMQSIIDRKEVQTIPLWLLCVISLLVIFFVEILQSGYLARTQSSKSVFVKYIVGSTYFLTVLTFLFTSVLLGISYLVFNKFFISFNMAWALTVITFLGTSRSMYTALKNYAVALREKHEKSFTHRLVDYLSAAAEKAGAAMWLPKIKYKKKQ